MISTPDPQEPTVETLYHKLVRFEKLSKIRDGIIVLLAACLIISASGWWFTSRSIADSEREKAVAICARDELAKTVDQFQILVSENATDAEKRKAAIRLSNLPTLQNRYQLCLDL